MADIPVETALRRRAYLDEVGTLGLGRLRALCGTLGGLSLFFGVYEAIAKPELFQPTVVQRVVFWSVCAVIVALTFLGERQAASGGSRRIDVRRLILPMTLVFIGAMVWMMEGIIEADDPLNTAYSFSALVLMGPAVALLLPLRAWQCVLVMAEIDNYVTINSVLEVDLFGQCNAEIVNGRQISGTGGLMDFVRGARLARNGRSVLAVQATAARGTVSRIVPRLPTDAIVSCPRADVDYVVTEHGHARLRDKSLEERAEALIAIAEPAFRSDLEAAWQELRRSPEGR